MSGGIGGIGMPRVLLTTYATDASAAKLANLNCPAIVNLAPPGKPWSGFKDKLVGMKRFLDGLSPRDVVCFTDAYDAICLSDDIDEIHEKFLAAEADVLFSAETSCFPWAHTSHLYNYTPTPYRYLNSGGYIGYVWALRLVLGYDMSQTPCDQGYFTYVYLNHINPPPPGTPGAPPPGAGAPEYRFKLDHECRLFQTAYAIPWTHFSVGEDGRFVNLKQNTRPCWIHFNGQQGEMKSGGFVLPIIAAAVRNRRPLDIGAMAGEKKHDVIKERATDADIVALAEFAASTYVPPDPARIAARDQVNHHAIFVGGSGETVGPVRGADFESKWHAENRGIVAQYFRRLASPCRAPLDVSLHDYVGPFMNDAEWPHSILSFSKHIKDRHNTLIPDLYAMQNYKGALDGGGAAGAGGAGGAAGGGARVQNAATGSAAMSTLKRKNKLLFIGKSTGARSLAENRRVALCRYARAPGRSEWIDAYLSGVANFDAGEAQAFRDLMRPEMTRDEQFAYRHLVVCDGNTACWDRLPWIMASKSVCWKEESDHECWYYLLMKPWVHYIPFTLENLAETWEKVKDDLELQLRIVAAANEFVECYLRPECHALYARTLLDRIAEKSGGAEIKVAAAPAAAPQAAAPVRGAAGAGAALKDPMLPEDIDIVWYCGDSFAAWSPTSPDLGGSEQAVVALSREWTALGKRVAVFGRFVYARTIVGGVIYCDTARYRFDPERAYPTLIIWRYHGLMLLDNAPVLGARRVWVDLHDNDPYCYALVARHQSRLHGVFFKSDFHRTAYMNYAANHGRDAKSLRVSIIPNGVRMKMFGGAEVAAGAGDADAVARDPYRFIYCSCYGRGLTAILKNIWPRIHRAEPRAELHLYYGIGEAYRMEPIFQEVRAVLGDTLGVMDHGRRPAEEVAAAKRRAMFHLYPTKTPSETDCISVRESAAAGCLPILLDYGVFKERDGLKVAGDPENPADGAAIAEQILLWMRRPQTLPGGSAVAARARFAASPTLVTWGDVAPLWLLRETTTPEQENLLQLAGHRNMPAAHVRYLEKLKEDGFNPRVIYDIGSCVLHWSQEARRVWPDARVICFEAYEPTEIVYRAAGIADSDVSIGVLGDADGKKVRFWENATMPGGNSCYREIGSRESAALYPASAAVVRIARTLDTVVRERGFPLPDLVKIDVQGGERDVVAGGRDTLRAAQHVIAELQKTQYNEGAPLADEVREYIESALGVACVAPLFCDNGPDGDYGFARVAE